MKRNQTNKNKSIIIAFDAVLVCIFSCFTYFHSGHLLRFPRCSANPIATSPDINSKRIYVYHHRTGWSNEIVEYERSLYVARIHRMKIANVFILNNFFYLVRWYRVSHLPIHIKYLLVAHYFLFLFDLFETFLTVNLITICQAPMQQCAFFSRKSSWFTFSWLFKLCEKWLSTFNWPHQVLWRFVKTKNAN